MTKEEAAHVARVVSFGCIVCRREGHGVSPAEAHHPRFGAGAGQRSSHFDVIPLCPMHHRIGGFGVAFHQGKERWQELFGTEQELLKATRKLLETPEDEFVP